MNEVQIFSFENSTVKVITLDGEPWFVASDVCRVLEIGNVTVALERLDEDEKGFSSTETPGGVQRMRIVNESGLYALVLGSRKPQAKLFKRWITHEVIPAIRKYGLYATEALLANPDFAIAALTQLKEEREKRKALELSSAVQKQKIAELQPKASYYDLILQNKDTVPVTQIAKDYGMSGRKFNALLHDLGIQYRLRNTWLLYQHYAEQGYTQSRTYALDAEKSVMHTYWTQKGRLFLYDLLKSEGILPRIEAESNVEK